jgi:CBS domain-containing protein
MKVKDVMSRDVVAVRPEAPLKEVARLMTTYGISGLPVVDESGDVVGVVSEADFLLKERGFEAIRGRPFAWILGESGAAKATRGKVAAATAGEMMSSPAATVAPDASLRDAAAVMVERRINRLPVTRGGHLVGIVTRADLVRAYLRPDEEIRRTIREDVILQTLWLAPERVEVEVSEGVVRLAGMLDRRETVEDLLRLVAAVDGVVAVESALRWQLEDSDIRLPEADLVARGYRR